MVAALPATGIKGTIYLVNHSHGEDDIYDEYIWVNGIYEKIGNTDVDLRNYIQKVLGANNKVSKFDSNGNLVSTGYELNKTVPADAVFTDTTYEDATQSVHGLMSVSDKTKLDEININNYSMKSDTVVCTEDEYNSLATKTAEFYYIIEED